MNISCPSSLLSRSFLRGGFLWGLLFFVVMAIPVRAVLSADEHEKRTKEIEQFVRTDLQKLEAGLAVSQVNISSRDLSHAALACLMLETGGDQGVSEAETDLRLFFKYQNMDSSSPDFGQVPWNPSNPNLRDNNAIEFTSSAMGPLFHLYADRFPKDFLDEAEPHLRAALVAIAHHQVEISYTNIALMKLMNQIILGEYLHDPATVAAGKGMLKDWIVFTRANGIGEFDSPTYSQTQISVVYDLYHNVQDPEVKAEAKLILDYYWTDLAANFFPGSGSLCGPYSRGYDFLTHDFNLSQIYYLNGIPARISTDRVYLNDQVQIWIAAVWNDYTPPDAALALASEPTRLILQRSGPSPGQDRTNEITPDFAIGSASHSYGAQDRMVSAALASTKDLPFINVVPDALDAPYGKIKVVDKGGHSKIHHLVVPISAVQSEGQVLALLNLAPGLKDPVSSVATDVIVPLKADALVVDGQPVDWGSGSVPLTDASVVGVREGNGAVAIRIFTAEAAEGVTPAYFLKNDGAPWGAGRVVAYQYQGPETQLKAPSLHCGILLLAAHCASDAEFQDFLTKAKGWTMTESEEGSLWKVTAQSAAEGGKTATKLEASLDDSSGLTGPRLVNGQAVAPPVLTINGVDWAGKLWSAPAPAP